MAPKAAMLPFNALGGRACLPEVLAALLAHPPPTGLAALVGLDPALCLQLLALHPAASAAQPVTLDMLLHHCGLQGLQAVAIPAALERLQATPATALSRQIWRRCVFTALLARRLARQLQIGNPEETYLAALLLRCGHWLMALHGGDEYAALLASAADDEQRELELEWQRYGATRLQVGTAVLRGTPLPIAAHDALRYHGLAADMLRDIHPLTRILHLADRLSMHGADANACAASSLWFQLPAPLLATLTRECQHELETLKLQWGLLPQAANGSAPESALARLQEALANRALQPATAALSPWRSLRITLNLRFGFAALLLLRYDATTGSLHAVTDESPAALADFRMRCEPGCSLVADAFQRARPRSSFDDATSARSLADEQLARLLGKPGLGCLPFSGGVLVLGLQADEWQALQTRLHPVMALLDATGRALPPAPVIEPAATASAETLQQRISETQHEMAAPLTALRNYLHLIETKSTDAGDELRIMRSELTRIGRIMDHLANPRHPAERSPVDLNKLMQDVLNGLQLTTVAAERQIDIHTELEPTLPVFISDAVALKQILTNLIHNALEAMPQGGRLRLDTTLQSGADEHRRWLFTVADTGPGIAPEMLARLFHPKSSSKPGHAGLGLSIVKRLVDGLGGEIDCQSVTHIGTRFVVRLPQAARPDAPP
ncbi:MAG: ATP-binding protein [Pseudomonadota bacterium]